MNVRYYPVKYCEGSGILRIGWQYNTFNLPIPVLRWGDGHVSNSLTPISDQSYVYPLLNENRRTI